MICRIQNVANSHQSSVTGHLLVSSACDPCCQSYHLRTISCSTLCRLLANGVHQLVDNLKSYGRATPWLNKYYLLDSKKATVASLSEDPPIRTPCRILLVTFSATSVRRAAFSP